MQHKGWLIVMEDCLNALRAMPTESVDVSPTSPPYNIGVDYNQHNDRMPRGVYLAWLGEFFIEMHRILKPGWFAFPGHQRQRYETRLPVAPCDC